jgi:hypothetical protein
MRHSCENVNDGNTGLEKAFCFSCTLKQEKVTPEKARQIAEEATSSPVPCSRITR